MNTDNKRLPSFKNFLKTQSILFECEEVLTEFEKVFSTEIVRADPMKRPFDFSVKNMRQVFNILNQMVFDNGLRNITLHSLNNIQICDLLAREYDTNTTPEEMGNHLAFHILRPHEGVGANKFKYVKTDKEAIVFNNSYGVSSFGYAVATLCHEMIHMYDYLFGDALKRGYAKNTYHIDFDEHLSPTFKTFMNKAREEYDIPVIVDGDGHSYFELNEEAQRYFLGLRDNGKPTVLTETEKTKNGSPIVQDKNDGSFVVVGFFDV